VSNFPPGYSEDGDSGPEGYVTEDRAEELFLAGAAAMREFIARKLRDVSTHNRCPADICAIVRSAWLESWGDDPGDLGEVPRDCWEA
jgi:hypothetical protein